METDTRPPENRKTPHAHLGHDHLGHRPTPCATRPLHFQAGQPLARGLKLWRRQLPRVLLPPPLVERTSNLEDKDFAPSSTRHSARIHCPPSHLPRFPFEPLARPRQPRPPSPRDPFSPCRAHRSSFAIARWKHCHDLVSRLPMGRHRDHEAVSLTGSCCFARCPALSVRRAATVPAQSGQRAGACFNLQRTTVRTADDCALTPGRY